jgi:predicted lipoprotein with Yx(FWY)xxD motif
MVIFSSCTREALDTPQVARTDIHLETSPTLGKYLVDKDGNALYYFSNDAKGQNTCTGGCAIVWKLYYSDTITYGEGLSAADFGVISPTSGARQITYKGWPLYYYSPGGVQEAPGETRGEGVGNVWFVAKTDYSIMLTNYQLTDAAGVNFLGTYAQGNGATLYFTDEKGNSLYTFARDSAFINKANNNVNFPNYYIDQITVPSTLDKTLFVLIDINGKKQLTYKGWPLYYYTPDNFVRGSNQGFHFPATQAAGAIWPIAVAGVALAPRK